MNQQKSIAPSIYTGPLKVSAVRQPGPLKKVFSNSALILSIIVLVGFVFNSGGVDLGKVQQSAATFAPTERLFRILTIVVAIIGTMLALMRRPQGIAMMFSGRLAILTSFAVLAVISTVFSDLKTMTLFKSSEILLGCAIASLLVVTWQVNTATFYLKGIFWIYSAAVASALIELAIFGTAHHKTLVGETPLLSTMMQSSYPPLVGNGLGYLGALVGLFGVYLFDSSDLKGIKRVVMSALIFSGGTLVLFLSYTRSVLVFYILSFFIYSALQRKFVRLTLALFVVLGALMMPSIQANILEHMKRGATTEQLQTLSGRTEFWSAIAARDPFQLMVGEGYATGTLFQMGRQRIGQYQTFGARNAHNSVAEIIMSTGLIGATIWLILMISLFVVLVSGARRMRRRAERDRLVFQNFLIAIFILSALRTIMNSTFVYLDFFFFLFMGLIAYCDSDRRTEKANTSTKTNRPLHLQSEPTANAATQNRLAAN